MFSNILFPAVMVLCKLPGRTRLQKSLLPAKSAFMRSAGKTKSAASACSLLIRISLLPQAHVGTTKCSSLAGNNCSRFHLMLPKTSQFVGERKLMQFTNCAPPPPTWQTRCDSRLGLVLREYKAWKKLPLDPPVSDSVSKTSGYMFNTDFLQIIVAFLNMEKKTNICAIT